MLKVKLKPSEGANPSINDIIKDSEGASFYE